MNLRFTYLLLPACLFVTGCADSSPTDTAASSTPSGQAASSAGAEVTGNETAGASDTGEAVQEADLLAPGSVAPEVRLTSVLHGEPFNGFSTDKVHVVEFWATWCGPCLHGMPHISQLQEQYGPQVQFVGITHEDEDTVSEFLSGEYEEGTSWKDLLKYSIALDDNGATNAAYMQAARQDGIPCAFIVDSGTIAWIGHPANLDEPLAHVVGGRWDVAAARQSFIQQASASKELSEQQQEAPEITLGAGERAPEVTLAAVVQGAPVAPFERGQVYVVEFWATWCGPCLKSMPHMSDLQEEYGREVQFIGVTDEDEETVTQFLEEESPSGDKWSDVLKYSIAIDDEDTTGRDYMAAAGEDGIPCAFIVDRTGQLAWVGHPTAIDEPLADVVAGRYDIKAAVAAFKMKQALENEEFDLAMKLLNALIKRQPDNLEHQVVRLQLYSHLGINGFGVCKSKNTTCPLGRLLTTIQTRPLC